MEIFLGAFTDEWERQRAAYLHDLELGRKKRPGALSDIEEIFRAGGGGGGAGGGLGTGRSSTGRSKGLTGHKGAARPRRATADRFAALARGSQPAVVKMASYGSGDRVGAMVRYVSRDGEISVETESGETLSGRTELAQLRDEWDHLMLNRAESRDVGNFRVEVAGDHSELDDAGAHQLARKVVSNGFGDRRFAYGLSRRADGALEVVGAIVLRDGDGERLTGDARAAKIVQRRYDASAPAVGAHFAFEDYGNGVDYASARLRTLLERSEGKVYDDRGTEVADSKQAGDLAQKEWRSHLHSRKGRDVMHVIMSARAGTDTAAFRNAARGFLAQQYGEAGYRYVFAIHDPDDDPKDASMGGKRPHVHAHAIVTMRSDFGDRIQTSPAVFREWREALADNARAYGIAMEMTDRRETASPPAYNQNQVRAVAVQGRTRHIGTSPAAQARYDAKRDGTGRSAAASRSHRYTEKAKQEWRALAAVNGDRQTAFYAVRQLNRLEIGAAAIEGTAKVTTIGPNFASTFRANMVTLQTAIVEGQDMADMSRKDFEAMEKRVETAIFNLERTVGPGENTDLQEIVTAARELINGHREVVALAEERTAVRAGDAQAHGDPRIEPDMDDWEKQLLTDEWEHANVLVRDIAQSREALKRIEAGEPDGGSATQYAGKLDAALTAAAQMQVIVGSDVIVAAARTDPQLATRIEQLVHEWDQQRTAIRAGERAEPIPTFAVGSSQLLDHYDTGLSRHEAEGGFDEGPVRANSPQDWERVGQLRQVLSVEQMSAAGVAMSEAPDLVAFIDRLKSDPHVYRYATQNHGVAAVEVGREALEMISTARRAIQTTNEAGRDTVAAYEDLNRAVLRVAEMAIGGNAFIHEARHKDPELRAAIEQAEMRQDLVADKARQPASAADIGAQAAERQAYPERGPSEAETQNGDSGRAGQSDGDADRADRDDKEEPSETPTTRGEPTPQKLSRLEEIERELRRQRDKDEFER